MVSLDLARRGVSAKVVFITIILSGMGGSFEIVGSWQKRGYSFNGHLESDGKLFWSSLTAGENGILFQRSAGGKLRQI